MMDTKDTRDPMDGMGSTDATRSADETAPADATNGTTPEIEEKVRTALRTVTDPELGINIVDLGLVYDVEIEEGEAKVAMTLTSPGCPAGGQILGGAKDAAESVDGVEAAVVSLVWKPFWTPERIDPAVRAMMGF